MDRPHVVVAARVAGEVVARLREGASVTNVSRMAPEAWSAALAPATGVLVNSGIRVDDAFLDAAPLLKIVATVSVGYDNIDTTALKRRGILLTNTRGSLNAAVADLTYALVIFAVRNLTTGVNWVRSGKWTQYDMPFGHDVDGATLGIIGFGAIGLEVAQRAKACGMRIIYYNRTPRDDDAATGASYRSFNDLLVEADSIVLLVPLSAETRGMFNDAAFERMKPTATLVNVSRGPVVDTAALLRALDRRTIAGAALDVTDPEPLPPNHPLLAHENVLITPHVGSATVETRLRMAMLAAENLLAFVAGKPLPTPVAL